MRVGVSSPLNLGPPEVIEDEDANFEEIVSFDPIDLTDLASVSTADLADIEEDEDY